MGKFISRTSPPFVLIHPADYFARAFYRVHQPAASAAKNGYLSTRTSTQFLSDEEIESMNPDAILFHQMYTDEQMINIRRYRQALPDTLFIYELDDLIWDIPTWNPNRDGFPPDLEKRLEFVFRMMDRIVCSTVPLAQAIQRRFSHKDIQVVPNYILREVAVGLDNYLSAAPSLDPGRKLRVGWAGGATHKGDLDQIAETVKCTQDIYQWVFFGFLPDGISKEGVEFHPSVEYVKYDKDSRRASFEYFSKLSSLDLDIAVAPLEINEFNRSKSNLRLLEYGACRYPVIATGISPYQGLPNFPVMNTTKAWIDALDTLASNEPLRNELADTLHDAVHAHFILEDHLDKIVSQWTRRDNNSLFLPIVEDEGNDRQVVVVGQHPEYPSFNSFEEARKAHPCADVLYIREGAQLVDPPDFMHLSNTRTVSFLSNDGFYPEMGKFVPILPMLGQVYSDLSKGYGLSEVPIPFPVGPVVYIPSVLLSKAGLPRVSEYKNIEIALAEWGISQALPEKSHILSLNHFAIAGKDLPFGDTDSHKVNSRYPGAFSQVGEIFNNPPVKEYREWLDIQVNSRYSPIPKHDNATYQDWCNYFDSPEAPEQIVNTEIKFSILMPVHNPNPTHLEAAIESVRSQYYPNWELCIHDDGSDEATQNLLRQYEFLGDNGRIKVSYSEASSGNIAVATNKALELATGEWTLLLDHDDTLAKHALLELSNAIHTNPEAVFFYSDEDKLGEDGQRKEAYFKPNFDYYLFLAQNYLIHASVYKTPVVRLLGGFNPDYNGSQDYDLTFRYLEHTGTPFDRSKIVHISRILYHWRQSSQSTAKNPTAKPYARENAKKAVLDHLTRMGQSALVAYHPSLPIYNQVRFMIPTETPPLVSIIIPTKDKVELLKICLDSILGRTRYPNYEIIVVDTGSKESKTRKYYQTLYNTSQDSRIRLIKYPFKFNWSAVNNFGVENAPKGDYFLFLNNDTEVVEPAWLDEMLSFAVREDIGTVGAKLIHANQSVQHVGASVWGGSAGHTHKYLPAGQPGYFGLAALSHEATAVTGACMMVSRSWFNKIGGFDPCFSMAFNDVAFCRETIHQGKRNIVCMTAVLYHHESSTRGPIDKDEESIAQMNQAGELLQNLYPEYDDYWNPNIRTYDLSYSTLSWPPDPFAWQFPYEERESVAVINGTPQIFQKIIQRGLRAVSIGANDFGLIFLDPKLPNVRPLDIREGVIRFKQILEQFKVKEIYLYHPGRADLTLYRFLERMGVPVRIVDSLLVDTLKCGRGTLMNDKGKLCPEEERYNRCEECLEQGSPGIYGYIDLPYFRQSVTHFMEEAPLTDFKV